MSSVAKNVELPLLIGSTFGALETTMPLLPLTLAREHPNIDLNISEYPDLLLEKLVSAGELDGGNFSN